MPVCLWVASAGGAESIILSVGDAETISLNGQHWEYDSLSVRWDHDSLSTVRWEYDALSAVRLCYYTMVTAAQQGAKKTTIGNTDDRWSTVLVNSASTTPPLVCRQRGPSFAKLPTDCKWGINATMPYCGCILTPLQSVLGQWSLSVGQSVGSQ